MRHAIKILLFVLVNAAGFYVIPVLVNLAIMTGLYPELPSGAVLNSFWHWIGFGGMCVWAAAALASLRYFFVSGGIKILFLLAPLYGPAIYGTALMAYFRLVPPL